MKIFGLVLILLLEGCASTAHEPAVTWYEERWGGVVQQELDSSCGLGSLLTVMRYHFGDERYDERGLLTKYMEQASEEELHFSMRNGMSMLELEALAKSVGYKTTRRMLSIDDLERVVTIVPVIVYLEIGKLRHFAVVRGVDAYVVWLADSSRGNVHHRREEFLSEWRTPEALRDEWPRPGGLIIMRPNGEFALKLLQEPDSSTPDAFRELRRQMIFQ
jgi:predicted double-glycine peptidase